MKEDPATTSVPPDSVTTPDEPHGPTKAAHQKGQAPHLPLEVTQVPREAVRAFTHHKKVGTYLLGRSLGEGSFAKVKEGLHLTTGEKVAVKIIDKKRTKTDRYVRKNLRREGRLLQQIRHNHVIQLLEVMETEHCYYLVTEFCAGGDLMDYITKRKRLDEKEAKRFIRQVVSAVDYLHRLGIIHRDLKIENLLLDENRNIKLIDFGLSNTIKVSTAPEGTAHAQEYLVTQCGSPAYAAPELLNHEKYGLPVDIWSIGVNMYAMLTGSLPFTVDPFNIRTLHDKMVSGQMNPLPPGLSVEAKDLLRKLLRADPEQRLTITEALRHPWLAEGRIKSMRRSPFPNKLKTSDLNSPVLKHMSDNLDFRLSETIRFVVGNIPSSACATYHLFHRKLQRHLAALEAQGRVHSDTPSDADSGKETTISKRSTPDTLTTQPQCEDYVQKETVPSPLLPSRRKASGTAKTGATTQPTPDKTAPGQKERICRFSVDHGLEEPRTSTKENRDHNRQKEPQLSSKVYPASRSHADGSVSISRKPGPAVISSLKPQHLQHANGTRGKQSTTNPSATPRRIAPKPSTVISATLHSSGLPGYTRRERTLAPLNSSPAGTRKDLQRESLKEIVRDSTVETVYAVKEGTGGKKGTLVLRTNHPATSTSVTISPGPIPAENGFTLQHVLQKRYKHERWRSAQTKTNHKVNFSDEVIRVTPLTGVNNVYNKRPVTPQTLPTIYQSFNKHSQNEALELGKQNDEKQDNTDCATDKASSADKRTAVDQKVVTTFPDSQSYLSSQACDPRIFPIISNGVTPRQ